MVVKLPTKQSAITHGKMIQYTPKNGVYSFFRVHAEQILMVVLNKNEEEHLFTPDAFPTMLESVQTFTDAQTGQSYGRDAIQIPARSVQIFIIQ